MSVRKSFSEDPSSSLGDVCLGDVCLGDVCLGDKGSWSAGMSTSLVKVRGVGDARRGGAASNCLFNSSSEITGETGLCLGETGLCGGETGLCLGGETGLCAGETGLCLGGETGLCGGRGKTRLFICGGD